ncbi:MAG: hypothetical protein JNL45_11390 [Hyphomicrobium sp.]|jgi:mono/diheme cytochrome c family protein|nr:hypothetical protein [Hyphomicrobium sp.]
MKAEFFRVRVAILAITGLIGAGAFPLQAAEDVAHGSADAGHTYANAVCAPCHAIEAGQKSSPEVKAPPFSAMVTNVQLTSHDIEGWLTSSHKEMPDFSVPADKRADLIAYIKSLALKP